MMACDGGAVGVRAWRVPQRRPQIPHYEHLRRDAGKRTHKDLVDEAAAATMRGELVGPPSLEEVLAIRAQLAEPPPKATASKRRVQAVTTVGGVESVRDIPPEFQPDLTLQVPRGKHKAARRAVVERRLHEGEWHGVQISSDVWGDAALEAAQERSQAQSQAKRAKAEEFERTLQMIVTAQVPVLPTEPAKETWNVADIFSPGGEPSEITLAMEAAKLLGKPGELYVSPGGVMNLARRAMTARILWLLRFHGFRSDGTRFSEELLRQRALAIERGRLKGTTLPYRTAGEIEVSPRLMTGLPRSSVAATIASKRGIPRHHGSVAERGEQEEESKEAVLERRRVRHKRRVARKLKTQQARRHALMASGIVLSAEEPRRHRPDGREWDGISEGGVSSGDSDDSSVIRAVSINDGSSRYVGSFGVLSGHKQLNDAIQRSADRVARMKAGHTSLAAIEANLATQELDPSESSLFWLRASGTGQPHLVGATESQEASAWQGLASAMQSHPSISGEQSQRVHIPRVHNARVPRLPLERIPKLHLAPREVASAREARDLDDSGFAFATTSLPVGSAQSARSALENVHSGAARLVLTDAEGIHSMETEEDVGFLPEVAPSPPESPQTWMKEALKEVPVVPNLVQMEHQVFPLAGGGGLLEATPGTLRFAMSVFDPIRVGGVGASRVIATQADESKHARNAEGTAEVTVNADAELEQHSLGVGPNSVKDLVARGIPTRPPSPEPYLPLTDRRPVRPPVSWPRMERQRKAYVRAHTRQPDEQAKEALKAASPASQIENLFNDEGMDLSRVSTRPRKGSDGRLARDPISAAAAADQTRRHKAHPHSEPISPDFDSHGMFLEVRGKYFSIPQAVMDEALEALTSRQAEEMNRGDIREREGSAAKAPEAAEHPSRATSGAAARSTSRSSNPSRLGGVGGRPHRQLRIAEPPKERPESPLNGSRAPLGSLAQQTRAKWQGWRRAPKRPIDRRQATQNARNRRLGRLSPRLEGLREGNLGPGDLFEVARADSDRRLQRMIESVEKSRTDAQRYRLEAVDSVLESNSVVDIVDDEIALMRVEAEIARTVETEAVFSRASWLRELYEQLITLEGGVEGPPAQRLVLSLIEEAVLHGKVPGKGVLVSALSRLTRDEAMGAHAQLLFAFVRRLARIPLSEWDSLHQSFGYGHPIESLIQQMHDTSG
jgi:hypothetical protein